MRRKKQYASRNEGYARDSYDDELANDFTEEEFFATISKDESALTYAPFQNEAFKKIEEGSAEMAQGDHGAYVVLTRNVLNNLDHTIDTDSQLFDAALTKEVASYQEKKGLKVTQTINAETVRALDKEAAAKQSGDDELTIAKRAKMLYLAFEHKSFLFFGGTDEKAVYRALSGITPKQKYELIEYYNAHYKSKRGKDLVRDLQHEMGGAELFKAINLLFTDYSPEESKTENYSFEGLDFQFQLPAVTVTAKRSWIKPKTKFTLLGGTIHFDCGYTPLRPVALPEGERVQGPSVRRIFVTHNKYTDEILAPTDDIKNDYDFDLGHKTFHWFSMKAKKPGPYLFTFVIRELDGTDSLHRVEHNVKVIANENSDRLKDNIPSSYLSYRYNVAKTEFQLQKNTVKDQKGIDAKFYIETASYTENPAEMGYADVNAVPHLYYSVKGANVDTSKKYLWFAEINQEAQEMKNLVDIYSKDVKLHGYQREEYDGKDGFKLKETGTEARFLRTIPGEFTIYCMQLDDNGNAVKQVAAYRQVVLPPEQYKVLAKYKSFKKDIDESFKKLDEKTAIPVNAVGTNLETTKTIPINLYLGKSTTNSSEYVLTDLTPGVQHQRDFTGSSIEEVFSELDEKNTYPRGMVSYSIPTNEHRYPTLKGLFYTDGMSMWDKISSEAGWASLGLAVAGVVASFTPAAPLAPFLFAAASAAGVTTGVASMVDKTQKGTITAKTATLDTLVIASSLLGMGGALSKAMVRGKSVIKLTETGYKYVVLQELKLSAASALMISYDGIKELAAINENENLSTADRIDYTIKTLAQLVIVNGLLALSAKSLDNVNANQELEITIYDAPEGHTAKTGQYKPKQDIEDIGFDEVLLSGETVSVQAQRNLPAANTNQNSSNIGKQTTQGKTQTQKELPVAEHSSQKQLPARQQESGGSNKPPKAPNEKDAVNSSNKTSTNPKENGSFDKTGGKSEGGVDINEYNKLFDKLKQSVPSKPWDEIMANFKSLVPEKFWKNFVQECMKNPALLLHFDKDPVYLTCWKLLKELDQKRVWKKIEDLDFVKRFIEKSSYNELREAIKSSKNYNKWKAAEIKKYKQVFQEEIGQVYPEVWENFIYDLNVAFAKRLKKFRGNDFLLFKKAYSGGEGQLFTSDLYPELALKRWYANRIVDMDQSIRLLKDAKKLIDNIPGLNKYMEVVTVNEIGQDYIVRGFDERSLDLGEAIRKDPFVEKATNEVIKILGDNEGEMAAKIMKKLVKRSDNLHWSSNGKILIIDMQ